MKDIVIIGAGDFGREIAHVVERINLAKESAEWNLLGFVDDNAALERQEIDGYLVVGDSVWLNQYEGEIYAICSVGVGKTREKLIQKFDNSNVKFATLIDPAAHVFKDCRIGDGCVICAGSVLAINTTVRNHVIVNLNCTLGHDDYVEDFCTINPGVNASGKVHLEKCVDLGTGSKIIQGLKIGENTTVGAGAVVIEDIPANCVAVGCPAKPVKWLE